MSEYHYEVKVKAEAGTKPTLITRWDRSGWRRPGRMPCVVCREVVVGAVCTMVHVTDNYLWWASSHCARTPATTNGDLA